MLEYPLAALFVLAAYLIGSIPFGLWIARWVAGIDIRTVGSGNIGATNVGRVLGFRYFWLVFLLDLAKGLLPTYLFPRAFEAITGAEMPALGVFVALAAILGHNFPVYLKFQGGKGVATSFGALIALDPVAMVSAGVGFVVFLLVTRMVSMSSMLAGVVFATVHFARVEKPWHKDELAMTLVTIALLILLFVRHRKNIGRILAGTEPRVSLRKKNGAPAGKIAVRLLLVLVVVVGIAGLAVRMVSRPQLDCGTVRLVTLSRLATGHQRSERVAFAPGGQRLVLTCPRYNRVILANVENDRLRVLKDIALEGRPVALATTADRLYVLARPIADAHHIEAGWLEAFDWQGRSVGSRYRVGFDPDDLIVFDAGKRALVLLSGNAEGETNRPDPELLVLNLAAETGPEVESRLTFDQPGDDPERVALSADERTAAVSLRGSNAVAWIDMGASGAPCIVGRTPLAEPRGLVFGKSGELYVCCYQAPDVFAIADPTSAAVPIGRAGPGLDLVALGPRCERLACSLPNGSGLEIVDAAARHPVGKMPVRGPANLSATRPLGLAFDADSGLLAVANRQGGSVHLIRVEPAQRSVAATDSGRSRR